jgi:bifunctional DNase/RNase
MKDILKIGPISSKIIFAANSGEEETFHQKDLIRLFPYGLSITTDPMRPFLLLKDEAHQHTLPVAVSPIEAGVAMAQSNQGFSLSSPHRFTLEMLTSLGIEVKQAVFVEVKNAHQYVRLYLSGHPKMNSIKLRADEAMSLCLYLDVPIYATASIIGKSKVLSTEIENAQNSVGFGERKSGYLN